MNAIKFSNDNDFTKHMLKDVIIPDQKLYGIYKYLVENIMSYYYNFDFGHNEKHFKEVLLESIDLICNYCESLQSLAMKFAVIIAAGFHDTGIINGREDHHLYSSEIMWDHFSDLINIMNEYFDKKTIYWILHYAAKIIESHRSSIITDDPYCNLLKDADKISLKDNARSAYRMCGYYWYYHPQATDEEIIDSRLKFILNKFGNKRLYSSPFSLDKYNAYGVKISITRNDLKHAMIQLREEYPNY